MTSPTLSDWTVYLVVRAFTCVVQSLAMETCHAISRVLAILFNDILRIRRKVVYENLSHAFPSLSKKKRKRLAREMWEHLFLMVCEVAHAPRKIHDSNWHNHVDLENGKLLVGTLLDPRPRILVSGHIGNFEMAGFLTGLLGTATTTIARPLDNPLLHQYLTSFRGSSGHRMLPKDGCAKQVALLLEEGGALSLLGDQYAGPKGCWIEFCNRPASCHKGVAVFSITSGAPLIVGYALRGDRPMHFRLGAVDVYDPHAEGSLSTIPEVTQWYSNQLETLITQAPNQYWWLHKRWKDFRKKKKTTKKKQMEDAEIAGPPLSEARKRAG